MIAQTETLDKAIKLFFQLNAMKKKLDTLISEMTLDEQLEYYRRIK